MNTMTSILERIEICHSFPAELSIFGFLYVPEYILGLWLLKQIFIKSNGRSVWKASTFKFEFFKRKELMVENQNSKALYISLAVSAMQIVTEPPLDLGPVKWKVCYYVLASL